MCRVRFAPSPTGEMHIGNLRTAIFNWLFAKINNGKFFIRIEDTDKARSKPEFFSQIFDILKLMKLDFDRFEKEGNMNGILIQSQRNNIYLEAVKKIIAKGYGFYCQCEPEAETCQCIDKDYKHGAVRYKVPKNQIISYEDMVFGHLEINTDTLENFCILRSDQTPTYMLAVVVDDIDMEISHVIRGEDHKTNTFKQILLYRTLESKAPQFGHLPMIIGEDGKKLSKRNGNTSVKYYIDKGYVVDAIFNMFVKLGWGSGNEEVITRENLLKIFKIRDIKKSPAKFDEKKLYSFSGKYLRMNKYIEEVIEVLERVYKIVPSYDHIVMLYDEISKRANTLIEMAENYVEIFNIKDLPISADLFELLINVDLSRNQVYDIIKKYCFDNNIDLKDFIGNLRKKMLNKDHSIDMFLIISFLIRRNINFPNKQY